MLRVFVLLCLVGCANQAAFEEGERLVAEGRQVEGLAKLQEAARREPGSARLRAAFLVQRDRVLQSLLDRADAARSQRRAEEAQALYRDVLALHPGNEAANAGLRAIENDKRWQALVAEAEALAAREDYDGARAKLRPVLAESPRHTGARDLQQRIERAGERRATEPALAASFRRPISIEFKDAPLRTVFDILARTSGLNFLLDKDVRSDQRTSIVLRDSTVEAALTLVLLTNQLEQRVVDANTVLIFPASAAKLREYQPLTVRSFYLSHGEAKVVGAAIRTITKTRDIVVDDKLNLIVVRDSPAAIRLVEKIVALHDVPEPEVMLEVEILEIKRSRLFELGVRLPEQLTLTPLAAAGGTALTLRDLRNIGSASIGAGLGATTITARKNETDTNLLANPRIRSRNREKARILIGERVPNITTTLTSTGFATDSVTYVDVGLKLDVEPVVYPDGEVAIRIALEVSNIIGQVQTKSGTVAYQIGTRGAQTVLRLADGENQVLAGLISDEERRMAYKLPGAGDIPVVGRLFGSQADDNAKTEIVLSITPRIVRNIPRPPAYLAEFDSGTEASVGMRTAGAGAAVRAGLPTAALSVPGPGAPARQATSPPGAALAWVAPQQVKLGDTLSVQLLTRSDTLIADFPMTLRYDPVVLQLTAAVDGDFMRQGGGTAQYTSRIDASGQVTLALSKAGGAQGSGVLTALTFRAIAASPGTALELTAANAVAPGGGQVAVQLPSPHVIVVAP